jgi:hypothetical protein
MRLLWLSLMAALLTVAACGGSDAPVRTDLPYELYCNIGNGDCQRTIYESVAAMLGEDGALPPIRTISVEQHANEVRAGLDLDQLTGEDARSRGLRLLGFIPEVSESVTATQAEYWINQIAAYYSRGSGSITVINRNYEEISAQALLAHELTHAIQDRQFGLNEVSRGANTEDGVMGVRGVIEGDAMHSSLAWTYDQLGFAPEEIDWDEIHGERQAGSKRSASNPEVALIDSAANFPYSYGFDYMTSATLAGGLEGRAAAFELPPATALEVMAPFEATLSPFDFPEVAHPAPIDGNEVQVENRFGAWYLYGFLRRRGMSDYEAWTTALSWLGDELAIYQNDTEVVAVWRVRFNHPLNATVLTDEVNEDEREVAWSAVRDDSDVFVFAAESEPSLVAWAAQPLDTMEAAVVLKGARRGGGPVSPGNCLFSKRFSVPYPPPLLHEQ